MRDIVQNDKREQVYSKNVNNRTCSQCLIFENKMAIFQELLRLLQNLRIDDQSRLKESGIGKVCYLLCLNTVNL